MSENRRRGSTSIQWGKICLLAAACLLLGLWPEPLVRLAEATAAWLGDPKAYIAAVLGG